MRLFEYVIFHNPKEGEKPSIIKPVTLELANSEEIVKMKAVRELSEEWVDKLEEIVIAVRPF